MTGANVQGMRDALNPHGTALFLIEDLKLTILSQIFMFLIFILLLGSLSGCGHLLYQPLNMQVYDPAQFQLAYEEVTLKSTDGNEIYGWYFPASTKVKKKGLILYFPGNGENISTFFMNLSWLPELGYSYFIFSYQGYWRSEGSPSPKRTVDDGIAAIKWLDEKRKQEDPLQDLIVYGQSLGGAVAMRTVAATKSYVPIKKLVLESTFKSYQDAANSILKSHFITWPFQWLPYLVISDEWAPEGHLKELKPIPILVIHGTADPIVGLELGKQLYNDLPEPKRFLEIPGGRHIDALNRGDGRYQKDFLNFIMK